MRLRNNALFGTQNCLLIWLLFYLSVVAMVRRAWLSSHGGLISGLYFRFFYLDQIYFIFYWTYSNMSVFLCHLKVLRGLFFFVEVCSLSVHWTLDTSCLSSHDIVVTPGRVVCKIWSWMFFTLVSLYILDSSVDFMLSGDCLGDFILWFGR